MYMLYNPPLSIAAKNKRQELVTLLLQQGADPNGRDHLGTLSFFFLFSFFLYSSFFIHFIFIMSFIFVIFLK